MQLCPANENAFAAQRVAASSTSASASTITGVALPSSRLTFFFGGPLPDAPADGARAGERDQLDALVLDEDVPDLRRGADDDVQPARGQAGLVLELREEERRQRRLRGGLEDDGAAGGERRRDLVRDEVERKVERRDRADHADRPPQRERELALAGLRGVHRHHLAGELARLDGRHRVRRHRPRHLDARRLQRLARLGGDLLRRLVGPASERARDAHEDLGALVRGERRLHRPLGRVERPPRLRGARLRDPRHGRAVVRRVDLDPRRRSRPTRRRSAACDRWQSSPSAPSLSWPDARLVPARSRPSRSQSSSDDPHPVLARLREREPVSWVPALDAWLVTRRDLVAAGDARSGHVHRRRPALLDGPGRRPEHALARRRASTAATATRSRAPFRLDAVRDAVRRRSCEREVDALLDADRGARGGRPPRRRSQGRCRSRRWCTALGLEETDPAEALGWYARHRRRGDGDHGRASEPDGSGREAFARLRASVEPALDRDPAVVARRGGGERRRRPQPRAGRVERGACCSSAGIETTEAMIANAFLHLLSDDDERRRSCAPTRGSSPRPSRSRSGSSLRRPCSTATRRAIPSSAAPRSRRATSSRSRSRARIAIRRCSPIPTASTSGRPNLNLQVAFAHGPHVCLGHAPRPARDARRARSGAGAGCPGLRLDPARRCAPRGLVFRKPATVHVAVG